MNPLEHHTLHHLREAEAARRAEQVRQVRERRATRPSARGTVRRSWLRLPRLTVRGRRPA